MYFWFRRVSGSLNFSKSLVATVVVLKSWKLNESFCSTNLDYVPHVEIKPTLHPQPINKRNIKGTISVFYQLLSYWWHILFRSAVLSYTFAPAVLTSPLLLSQSEYLLRVWWDIARYCLSRGGPCTVKFAQWMSTRPDLFPVEVCKQLQSLQSRTNAPNWSTIEPVLIEYYGPDYANRIEVVFKETPHGTKTPPLAGSGCVAYVLRGRLISPTPTNISTTNGQSDMPTTMSREVAIKITHPNVTNIIKADIELMRTIASALEHFLPSMRSISLYDSVQEFSKMMLYQINMETEGRSLAQFRKNFHIKEAEKEVPFFHRLLHSMDRFAQLVTNTNIHNVRQEITFPEPIWEYTNESILMEAYEDGILMNKLMHHMDTPTKRKVAQLGMDAIFKMIFIDNFIHADLHPGNIICLTHERMEDRTQLQKLIRALFAVPARYRRDHSPKRHTKGTTDSSTLCSPHEIQAATEEDRSKYAQYSVCNTAQKLQLSFIDAGLIVSLNDIDRVNFIDLFKAVIMNEGREAGRLMIERARGNSSAVVIKPDEFCDKIGEIVTGLHGTELSLGKVDMNSLLEKVLVLCYQHQVKLESRFVSVIVAIGVLEGVGRQLDPDVDLLKRVTPYALRAAVFHRPHDGDNDSVE